MIYLYIIFRVGCDNESKGAWELLDLSNKSSKHYMDLIYQRISQYYDGEPLKLISNLYPLTLAHYI